MLKGICTNCGKEYYGWALQKEEHQKCDHCEGDLLVEEETEWEHPKIMTKEEYLQWLKTRDKEPAKWDLDTTIQADRLLKATTPQNLEEKLKEFNLPEGLKNWILMFTQIGWKKGGHSGQKKSTDVGEGEETRSTSQQRQRT